jgi:hypothetical protein
VTVAAQKHAARQIYVEIFRTISFELALDEMRINKESFLWPNLGQACFRLHIILRSVKCSVF